MKKRRFGPRTYIQTHLGYSKIPFPRCVTGASVCAKTSSKLTKYGAKHLWEFALYKNDKNVPDTKYIYVDITTFSTNRNYNGKCYLNQKCIPTEK